MPRCSSGTPIAFTPINPPLLARIVLAIRFATATAASLIFPFAPHLGAEVYELLTGERVWEQPWPEADPELLQSDVVTYVVQVNGKLRDRIEAAADTRQAPRVVQRTISAG